jgi:muconate cycloisomerase
VRLRGDVNGAWSEKTASAALAPLADLGLELLEQPVAAEDLDALARLARGSRVPIAADEALALPAARARLTRGILTPIAVLKPGLLGGLRAASLLARGAAASGVRVLITTSFDGPLGTAAALHLAAAVADPELACGLATLEALEGDWPATLLPVEGTLTLSSGIGLGLEAT